MESRVRVLVTTRLGDDRLDMVALQSEPVEHYRNERQIATALRKLADDIEVGASFAGVPVVDLRSLGDRAWKGTDEPV